jgi:hypothetical protein
MSRLHAFPKSLVVATALLVPAILQAQAKTDSISTTPAAHSAATGLEAGQITATAADTGQAGMKAATTSKAAPDRRKEKSGKQHHDAAADSVKTRDDTARDQSYIPY